MANASWPAGLPQFVLEQGFNEALADTGIETAMEAGRPKSRRRYTRRWRQFTVTIACSSVTQRDAFDTFYETTLADGTRPFDWVDPVHQTPCTFKFRKPAPKWSVRNGATHLVSFALERIA